MTELAPEMSWAGVIFMTTVAVATVLGVAGGTIGPLRRAIKNRRLRMGVNTHDVDIEDMGSFSVFRPKSKRGREILSKTEPGVGMWNGSELIVNKHEAKRERDRLVNLGLDVREDTA